MATDPHESVLAKDGPARRSMEQNGQLRIWPGSSLGWPSWACGRAKEVI